MTYAPMSYTDDEILDIAAGLISEDAENSEYDRAIVEMTCGLLGITDDRGTVEHMIRSRSHR